MKNIHFFNILIIFFYLISCHRDSFIEEKPLKAAAEVAIAQPSSSKKEKIFHCQICFEVHPFLNTEAFSKFNYSPVFIGNLEHLIAIKDPQGDINTYLKNITDKHHAFALHHLFAQKMNSENQNLDETWHNFLKIIHISELLPSLVLRFNQISANLRKNPTYFALYEKFENFVKSVTLYNNKSIDSLKGDQTFIALLKEAEGLIEELPKGIIIQKDPNFLSSLKKDIELAKKLFETIHRHQNLP